MRKNIFKIILIIILGLLQLNFINTLPYPLNNFLLFIDLIVIFILLFYLKFSLWYLALIFGIIFDLHSSFPLGIITICLLLIVLSVNFIFKRFFTTISPLSLIIIGSFAIIIYNSLLYVFINLSYFMNISDFPINFNGSFLKNIAWQVIINIIFLMLVYLIFYKRFKKLFTTIEKENAF